MTYHRSVRPYTELGNREHKIVFLKHPKNRRNVIGVFIEEMVKPGFRLGIEVTGQLGPVAKSYIRACENADPEEYQLIINTLRRKKIKYKILYDSEGGKRR